MFKKLFEVFQGKEIRLGDGTNLFLTRQPMALTLYEWIEEACPNFWYDLGEFVGHEDPKKTFATHLAPVVSHVYSRSPFGNRPPTPVEKKGG